MQLVLELLKKIFIALQGNATKLAEHDAEIDTLQKVTSGLGEGAEAAVNVAKWQTYATAAQKEVDAETAMQLAQDFARETDEYLANPNAENTLTKSENEYADVAEGVVVDFNVTKILGTLNTGSVFPNKKSDCLMFFPRLVTGDYVFYKTTGGTTDANGFSGIFVCPSLEASDRGFMGAPIKKWYSPMDKFKTSTFTFYMSALESWTTPLPAIEKGYGMFQQCIFEEFSVDISSVRDGRYMFNNCSKLSKFSSPLTNLSQADAMFRKTNLPADQITAILDGLPTWASGTHVISFTDCPGASELTQDSPSVASAVAKGWTCEL